MSGSQVISDFNAPKEERMSQLYKTYLFKEKDPAIGLIAGEIAKRGISYEEIAERSGVREQTLRAWFWGKTKRPQFATLEAVARALGLRWELRKGRGKG